MLKIENIIIYFIKDLHYVIYDSFLNNLLDQILDFSSFICLDFIFD